MDRRREDEKKEKDWLKNLSEFLILLHTGWKTTDNNGGLVNFKI